VAHGARYLRVGALERERRLRVVEAPRLLPHGGVVAVCAAARAELLAVGALLPVAAGAIGGQAEERAIEGAVLVLACDHESVTHSRGRVAAPAVELRMGELERQSYAGMLEGTLIEAHQREVSPEMVLMTGGTVAVRQGCVISAPGGDSYADLLVAR
jgi:hypothetical protein